MAAGRAGGRESATNAYFQIPQMLLADQNSRFNNLLNLYQISTSNLPTYNPSTYNPYGYTGA